ncbi:MAG: methylmalonyl-CoA epimerase [Candidatus Methylomirabilales bacterium]
MFTRILHVSIAVRSLEQALPFYRDVLGLPVGEEATVADQGVRAALLSMQDGEIELLEPTDPAGGVARFLERRGEGLHHLCLETPDVAAALTHAKAVDLPLIDQSPRPGLAGMIAFLHPKASHGVLVELAQPLTPPAHPDPPGAGIQALGLATVYVVVKDLLVAAATYARNFQGGVGAVEDHPYFGARRVLVSIGSSQITLLSPADRKSPVGCFLADREEGLFGVCLRVMDLEAALLHLETTGIATEVHRQSTATPLARLDPIQVNGVNLFLCAGTSNA